MVLLTTLEPRTVKTVEGVAFLVKNVPDLQCPLMTFDPKKRTFENTLSQANACVQRTILCYVSCGSN